MLTDVLTSMQMRTFLMSLTLMLRFLLSFDIQVSRVSLSVMWNK